MYFQCETVRVKREGGRGWHTINKSDFDPKKHELFNPDKPEEPKRTRKTLRLNDDDSC